MTKKKKRRKEYYFECFILQLRIVALIINCIQNSIIREKLIYDNREKSNISLKLGQEYDSSSTWNK